jgi:hypothetical protein
LTEFRVCNSSYGVLLGRDTVSDAMGMHDEDAGGPSGAVASGATDGGIDVDAAEARLEVLADEIGAVLAASPAAEREALHDYAVSLVRERLPAVDADYSVAAGEDEGKPADLESSTRRTSGAVTSLGYGVLIIFAALPLLPIFGPIGAMLLILGLGMVVWGGLAAVFMRLKPKSVRAR